MNSSGKLLFLGSGGSMGVPLVGCDCDVCTSTNLRNKRLRPSVLLSIGTKKILVDVGFDFRQQALNCNLKNVDGVLFTHVHADHIAGIDDLRAFYFFSREATKCLASEATYRDLRIRYYYLFGGNGGRPVTSSNITAQLDFQVLENSRGEVEFSGVPIRYFTYHQGKMPVTGFRFGEMAYVTDICEFPESIFEDLDGVKTLIVSAAQYTKSKIHFCVDDAISFSQRVGSEKTWLNHITHQIDHEKGNAYLPSGIEFSYDGLEIDFLM